MAGENYDTMKGQSTGNDCRPETPTTEFLPQWIDPQAGAVEVEPSVEWQCVWLPESTGPEAWDPAEPIWRVRRG